MKKLTLVINWVVLELMGPWDPLQSILFPPSLFGQGLASVRLVRNNAAAGLL